MKTVKRFAPDGATGPSAGQGSGAPKWSQLRAIEEAREPLGIKATSISILRAMLSYMSADRISELADDQHIVFASNASIAQRAHVSIQTVERHIARLVSLGVIQRITAANGKRWVRRDRAGQVTLISGLSLLPIATRHAEFTALAGEYRQAQDALQLLRDQCTLALARLKGTVTSGVQDLLERARIILRRRPQKTALEALLDEINEHIAVDNRQCEEPQPINLTDANNETEGHKEQSLTQNSKERKSSSIQVTQDQMERAFPRLCSELRFAKDQVHCDRIMDELANHLLLGQAWYAMKASYAPATRFMALGYVLERAESIHRPLAYLRSLLSKIDTGEIEHSVLLRPFKAGRGGMSHP